MNFHRTFRRELYEDGDDRYGVVSRASTGQYPGDALSVKPVSTSAHRVGPAQYFRRETLTQQRLGKNQTTPGAGSGEIDFGTDFSLFGRNSGRVHYWVGLGGFRMVWSGVGEGLFTHLALSLSLSRSFLQRVFKRLIDN